MKKPTPPSDLWAKMDAIAGQPAQNDPGITAAEFAERYQISGSAAARRLKILAREGKLIAGWKKELGSKRVIVFRPAE